MQTADQDVLQQKKSAGHVMRSGCCWRAARMVYNRSDSERLVALQSENCASAHNRSGRNQTKSKRSERRLHTQPVTQTPNLCGSQVRLSAIPAQSQVVQTPRATGRLFCLSKHHHEEDILTILDTIFKTLITVGSDPVRV